MLPSFLRSDNPTFLIANVLILLCGPQRIIIQVKREPNIWYAFSLKRKTKYTYQFKLKKYRKNDENVIPLWKRSLNKGTNNHSYTSLLELKSTEKLNRNNKYLRGKMLVLLLFIHYQLCCKTMFNDSLMIGSIDFIRSKADATFNPLEKIDSNL